MTTTKTKIFAAGNAEGPTVEIWQDGDNYEIKRWQPAFSMNAGRCTTHVATLQEVEEGIAFEQNTMEWCAGTEDWIEDNREGVK